MLRKMAVVSVLSLSLLLVACKEEEAIDVPDKEQDQQEESNAPVEQADETLLKLPFTGEVVAQEIERRPILVTINNHPAARPQSGIASADIVYEMLAEGDVTRYLALFQSELPENVGPVRSARSYFVDIAAGLDALYVAHGYSPEAKSMLENNVVDNLNGMNYDGTLFKRASHRVAPHNSYITPENIFIGAEKIGASTLHNKKVSYTFYDEQESGKIGVAANQLSIQYSQQNTFNSTYEFDEETKQYAKFTASQAVTDELTGEQVQVANVLFFEMPHEIVDQQGRRDIDIKSGGKALVAYNGTIIEGAWENRDGMLVAVQSDGSLIPLKPGKSWIHFVPTSPGLSTAVTYTE